MLKRLCSDLLLSHPDPDHLHIIPTARDPSDGLALSSRNAYLSPDGRKVADTLRAALKAAEDAWDRGIHKAECVKQAITAVEARILEARSQGLNVEMRLDYVELNDSLTFEELAPHSSKSSESAPVVLSGALWVDKTRLIDNIILGDANEILA